MTIIDIHKIPPAGTDRGGIDMMGRVGNVQLQVRETIGRRESQEDQIFTIVTPASDKETAAKLLQDAFKSADERTHYNQEGSCATVAILSKDNFVTIAHLGDSPVVLFVVGQDKKVTAIIPPGFKLHKPDDAVEKARIEKAGGFVQYGRVDGRLAISRALGDHDYGDKVSKEPDITQFNLSDYVKSGEKAYLCVSCDGLYEGNIPENHFAQIIQKALEAGELRIANKMKDYAAHQGSGDNISVILAELPDTLTKSIALGVCDGHGGSLTSKQASAALQETIAIGKIPVPPAKTAGAWAEQHPSATSAPLPYAGNWYTAVDFTGEYGGNKGDIYWYINLGDLPPNALNEITDFLKTVDIKHAIRFGYQDRRFLCVIGADADKIRVLKKIAPKIAPVRPKIDEIIPPDSSTPTKAQSITPDSSSPSAPATTPNSTPPAAATDAIKVEFRLQPDGSYHCLVAENDGDRFAKTLEGHRIPHQPPVFDLNPSGTATKMFRIAAGWASTRLERAFNLQPLGPTSRLDRPLP